MKRWIAIVVLLTTGAVVFARDTTHLILDVPFVSQTEALCGGAAAAMVLRYWGARGIYASDFASLVEDSIGGIRTGRLVADLKHRGYVALAFDGTEGLVGQHLRAGRPIIALIEDRPQRYHYVVLLAWENGNVLVHNPATAPFRVVPEQAFNTAWETTGRWSLLVLPDTMRTELSVAEVDSPVAPSGTFTSLLSEGIRLGRANDLDASEVRLHAATVLWPDSAAAWRELAGIRFRQKRWRDAAMFAHRASRLDRGDAHTWRLLGATYFLEGRMNAALFAWNQVGEPHLDLMRIDGLKRTRFAIVSDRLGLAQGSLVTPQSFRRARRRLSDFPIFESSRLDYKPLPGGIVEVDAVVQERPLFLSGPIDAIALVVKTVANRELAVSVASPTGNGELWTAAWRWEENRPSVRLAVSGSGVAGLPGVLSVEGFREQQTYGVDLVAAGNTERRIIPQGTDSSSTGTVREARRRAGLAWREWVYADLLCEADIGFEHWEAQNSRFMAAGLALDLRRLYNVVSLRIQVARWFTLGLGRPFSFGTADIIWRPPVAWMKHTTLEARLGYRVASADAPPALWLGAGTGRGRADLLRAHPLLEGGIVRGPVFGRSLLSAGLEFDYRPLQLGVLQAGLACFVDMARSSRSAVPAQVDVGIGIRLAGFSPDGELLLDAAHGLRDGANAISLIWRAHRY